MTRVPVCCYCRRVAVGRVVFKGNDEQIVDNPFCGDHLGVVHEETERTMRDIHKNTIYGDLLLVQKWPAQEQAPVLPTISEFLSEASSHFAP